MPSLVVLAIAGCMEGGSPTALDVQGPVFAISDAAHGTENGLFFLPPMVTNPKYSGDFDAAADPEVFICAWVSGECLPGSYSASFTLGGPGGLQLDAADENYKMNWPTRGLGFRVGAVLRVHVLRDGAVLGYADVVVVGRGNLRKQEGFVGILQDQPLLIKFRVEADEGSPGGPGGPGGPGEPGDPDPTPTCGNTGGGALVFDNGTGTGTMYCYNEEDTVDTRARKACESHYGVGNCSVLPGGYSDLQWGRTGSDGSDTMRWHPDDHPFGHCGPTYRIGDVMSEGWCSEVIGRFLP